MRNSCSLNQKSPQQLGDILTLGGYVVPTRVCQAIHQGMFRHFQMLRDVSDCVVAMVTRLSLLPTHHRQEPLKAFMRYKICGAVLQSPSLWLSCPKTSAISWIFVYLEEELQALIIMLAASSDRHSHADKNTNIHTVYVQSQGNEQDPHKSFTQFLDSLLQIAPTKVTRVNIWQIH